MKGEQRSVGSVYLLPDNPRHGDIGAISESLRRFGQQKPIVVNSEGVILAGNHTYQAAVMLGWEKIWVVESGLEGSDQTGFALADNRLSDLATYDHDILLGQLEQLDDLEGTGYDLEDMDELRLEVNGPAVSGDERYTPAWVFEGMGVEFDVDLAAPEGGISYIPAKTHYTKQDDALTKDWRGMFAWCNPPYSIGAEFGRKWTAEIEDGVWLGPQTNSSYRVDLMRAASAVWLPDHLEFHHGEDLSMIRYPTFFAAFGSHGLEALTNMDAAQPHKGCLFVAA